MRETLPSFESILHARFGAITALEDGERSFLSRIAERARDTHPAEERLWSETNPARPPALIVSGWACSARSAISGARQIVEILLPGDLIGFGIQSPAAPAAIVSTLTPLRTIAAPELSAVWKDRHLTPRMAMRLEAMLVEQHFLMISHITRLGRFSAYGRMTNLLAELHWRLERVGLTAGPEFPMPLTQDQIADTLGLSVVHVNRTLQQLRREGLVVHQKRRVRLMDVLGIYAAGEFRPPVPSTIVS